jgi:hypothetical protein
LGCIRFANPEEFMLSIDRKLAGMVVTVAAWAGLAACNGTLTAAAQDPCTLLSAAEAGPYVGALATPPYRASDGAADVHGDECMYRGTDGREIAVRPDWSGGGAQAGAAVQGAANLVGSALDQKAGGGSGDTLAHRVVKSETAGPWDRATWIPGGSLFASKGTVSAQIDVTGASGQESDALALARIIMPRFAHPLDYDGAKAVALVPKPRPHPAKACDLVPRAAVEAAIGPLTAAPTSDSPETSCSWTVATPQGERVYAVEFTWQGGQKNFMMQEHAMATVGGMMGTPTTSALDTMHPPPQMQAMMGGLMKMVGGKAAEGKAPGAASTVGFRTDTTLTGPWDHAALLHGTQLIAVRHDVFVGMNLESADYEKAKALLAAICSRL